MLDQKLVEKELTYSGFDVAWIQAATEKNDIAKDLWENLLTKMDEDIIVFSAFFGKYLKQDCCAIATNRKLYLSFVDSKTNEKIIEELNYLSLSNLKIDKKNKEILLTVTIDAELTIKVSTSIPLMVTHWRRVIFDEISARASSDESRHSLTDALAKRIEGRKDDVDIIESEIKFEPYSSGIVNKSFDENFKKIRTIYHVRRIITGMLIVWIPVLCFSVFLATWRFDVYMNDGNGIRNLTHILPTTSNVIVLTLSGGVLGTTIYFYIYQKYLHNRLVNSLCYLLMTFLVIDIIANMVSLITISSLANQLVIKGANSIQDENSLFHVLSMAELLTGILLLVTTVFSFVPILILNIGIYRKNKA
jgi:hypothetical protein